MTDNSKVAGGAARGRKITKGRDGSTPSKPAPAAVKPAQTAKAGGERADTQAAKIAPAPPVAPVIGEKVAASLPEVAATEYNVEVPVLEIEDQTIEQSSAIALEGTVTMSDIIESTKKIAEEAKTRMQGAFAELSEKAKAGVEKSTKAVEELGDITKGNVEALVESGKIATKGFEAMSQEAAEYSRMTFEKASAAMKELASVKTPAEFFQLQSEMVSANFDAFAKATAKNSEALMKLVGEVTQPISTRVSIVTEKVKSLAA